MPKIKYRATIKNSSESSIWEGLGILNNDQITHVNEGITTIVSFKANDIKIRRRTEEYDIELLLNKDCSSGTYKLLNNDVGLELEVKSIETTISKNHVFAKYSLKMQDEDMGIFTYEINYEVIK